MKEFLGILPSAEFFCFKDAQANIVELLDNTGATVVKYKYDAWGAAGGALGGLMEGAITPVRVIAQKTGKPLSKVLTKVIQKAINEIGPSYLAEQFQILLTGIQDLQSKIQ